MPINKELYDAIVEIVRHKPGKEELTPENLKEAIERTAIGVSKFCKLRLLPLDLKYTLADIVANVYDMLNPIEEEDDTAARVKSIKQGDTTLELATVKKASYASMDAILKAYIDELMPYRGMFWK